MLFFKIKFMFCAPNTPFNRLQPECFLSRRHLCGNDFKFLSLQATRRVNNARRSNRRCYCEGAHSYDPCRCPATQEWCNLPCFKRDRNQNWQCSDTCSRCFPSTAKVTLENDNSINMSELQTGDKVQIGTDICTTPDF